MKINKALYLWSSYDIDLVYEIGYLELTYLFEWPK